MSLGDESVVGQQGSAATNTITAPVNCLPVPPPVSPPVKQASLNSSLKSGNRNLIKSNSVPSRSKMDKIINKQESFETENGIMPSIQRLRV